MAKKTEPFSYEPVDASPVKSFFVTMLTRDISLADAILDLLDNCVDGILRTGVKKGEKPYAGHYAHISFDGDTFEIKDNCGGIPWDKHSYAFRMGRSREERSKDNGLATVGTYGIGMKRALFKLGKDTLISTQNKEHNYEVAIDEKWIAKEDLWEIPVQPGKSKHKDDGTTIVVGNLYEGVSKIFAEKNSEFETEFIKKVAGHYAFIIAKGFEVKVNKHIVPQKATKLAFADIKTKFSIPSIRPFIYESKINGVDVFLAVGFTRAIPSQEEAISQEDDLRYSTLDAGWTVLCNDRAVLYCDKTELTGWGEAGVPSYHTQFIAISGVVEFSCDDASKLPTTTTKRGIDASSTLYLQVKNKMREGMRMFTDYTNKWKGRAEESKLHIESAPPRPISEIREAIPKLQTSKVTIAIGGRQYKPHLPMPAQSEPRMRTVTFKKDVGQIKAVSSYLFSNQDETPSKVGERCFEQIYKEAQK